MRVLLLLGVFWLAGGPAVAHAQSAVARPALYGVQYRPADARYLVGHYPHFDVIYQEGTEATAFRIAAELEAHRAATDSLVGRTGAPLQMPVVVNGYNDRSNGFVSPLPFRQEIEAVSINSEPLTTHFPSWPAAVAPHELVHAAHADLNAGLGLGGLVRLAGPDWSRVINLTAPRGLIEGVAVYQESRLHANAGRLHAPIATMKVRAALLADAPWSLTQMLEAPAYTRPFDRHYLGGGRAFAYLQARDDSTGGSFFHRATRLHHRLPVVGFGAALWHGTGTPPWRLAEEVQAALVARERARQAERAPATPRIRIDGAPGLTYRRPHWTSDSTLVVHAEGYATRPGFYRVHARTGRRTLISAQRLPEDAVTTLSRDSTALYFARYVPDRLVLEQFAAEVHRLRLADGAVAQLTRGGRAHAPVEAPSGRVWALRNDGAFNQWGVVQPDGAVTPITSLPAVRIEQVAPAPDGRTVAVLLNDGGAQRLYQATAPDVGRPRLAPWLGIDGGAIYDVTWGPRGRYLVFAAAVGDTPNLFALDTEDGSVRQLTRAAFGALEPTVSPDGTSLAFVDYQHERFDLVRMPFRPGAGPRVDASMLVRPGEQGWSGPAGARAPAAAERSPARITPYRPAARLAPRLVYPTLGYDLEQGGDPLGLKVGLAAAGADPLRRWAYTAEAFVQAGRPWGQATVQSGRFLTRPRLTAYATPTPFDRTRAVEERGVELSGRVPITFDRNATLTQAQIQVGGAFEQARFIDGDGAALTGFSTRGVLRPAAAFGYRLGATLRDLAPTRGLLLRSVAEIDAWSNRTARRGWRTSARLYLPVLARHNTSLSVYGRLLTQNRPAVLSADAVLPRGYAGQGRSLPAGTFGALGTEVVHPITFIDDGWTTVPLYLKSLYAYGFAEALWSGTASAGDRSAFGGGVGLRFRFFYVIDADLRLGLAVRPSSSDVRVVTR